MELDISGAKVYFTIPTDIPILGDIQISETMVVSWIVMLHNGLCIWLTHDLRWTVFERDRLLQKCLWNRRISLLLEIWVKNSSATLYLLWQLCLLPACCIEPD